MVGSFEIMSYFVFVVIVFIALTVSRCSSCVALNRTKLAISRPGIR